MEDHLFLKAFEDCTLPFKSWTHHAHVRMAWLYLKQYPWEEALLKIRCGIQKYNISNNNFEGYHDTVTTAYANVIYHCLKESKENTSWDIFTQHYPDLFDRENPPLLKYYQKETLLSTEARENFIKPDLGPLPFEPEKSEMRS